MSFDTDYVETNPAGVDEYQFSSDAEQQVPDEVATLREQNATLQQQYKSLQGQFKHNNPNEMAALRAQIDELRAISLHNQQPKEPQAPSFELPEDVRSLFGEQAGKFEGAIGSRLSAQSAENAELRRVVEELSRQVQAAPYEALKATDSDYSSQAFNDFLNNDVDDYGISAYDRIKTLSREQSIRALSKAKERFKASTAKGEIQTSPAVRSAPASAPSNTPAGKDRIAADLRKQYSSIIHKPMTEETLNERLRIRSEATKHGITLQ